LQLTLPCEYSVKEILPAIRAIVAEKLVNEKKVSIYKAAELMGLTPAAVENYIKKRRGITVKEILRKDKRFMDLIDSFTDNILNSNVRNQLASYYCILCAEGKKTLSKNGYQLSHCLVESLSYDFSFKK
jgi:predicted transcriptional regulator